MDAGSARGVVADVGFGIRIDVLLPIAIGLLVSGGVLLIGGAVMLVLGARGRRAQDGAPPTVTDGDGGEPVVPTPEGGTR